MERWWFEDVDDDDFDYINLPRTLSVIGTASVREGLVPEEYDEESNFRKDSYGFEHPEGI